MSRELIKDWYKFFAPGLPIQTIPDEAQVVGPLKPLVPYGVQYRVQMPDGSSFPRHQSGPGATIAVTDGRRVVIKQDFRPESGAHILKCAGGFAGNKNNVAADMVKIFNILPNQREVKLIPVEYKSLYEFFKKLLEREYNGWTLGEQVINFIIRPIGNPNIRICSILGYLLISPDEFDAHQWPMVATKSKVATMIQTYQFGDQNTDLLLRDLMLRGILHE